VKKEQTLSLQRLTLGAYKWSLSILPKRLKLFSLHFRHFNWFLFLSPINKSAVTF
jgi:hypothetical protein